MTGAFRASPPGFQRVKPMVQPMVFFVVDQRKMAYVMFNI